MNANTNLRTDLGKLKVRFPSYLFAFKVGDMIEFVDSDARVVSQLVQEQINRSNGYDAVVVHSLKFPDIVLRMSYSGVKVALVTRKFTRVCKVQLTVTGMSGNLIGRMI